MASLDELLTSLFGSLGPVGSLVILVIIFALDAALFPALPEVWIVVTYTYRPTEMLGPVAWAGLLLAMAVAGDVLGTSLLYVAVRRWVVQRRRMPRWLERAMKKLTGFLLVQDERVILMNRVVPVIPMVGAFIAALGWDYRWSMACRDRRPREVRHPVVCRVRDRARLRRRDRPMDHARARRGRGRFVIRCLLASAPSNRGVLGSHAVTGHRAGAGRKSSRGLRPVA